MRIYWIDIPYASSGLRRTYRKNLEVFSGIPNEGTLQADTICKYMPNKKCWVEKTTTNSKFSMYIGSGPIVHSSMPTIQSMRRYDALMFTTVELAQAAKLILVEVMAKAYQKELEDLQELFDRNVPKVGEPLKALKEDYPEYFI